MNHFNEASLNPALDSRLKKKGIKATTDSISELDGRGAIIDTKNYQALEDASFMKMLLLTCQQVSDYSKRIVYVPVSKWYRKSETSLIASKNPLGAICRYIRSCPEDFKKEYSGVIFLFFNEKKESFSLYPEEYKSSEYRMFENLLHTLVEHSTPHLTGMAYSKSPVKNVVSDTYETKKADRDWKKDELVASIANAAEDADTEEEAWESLEDDEYVKQLILDLEEEEDGKPQFNNARTSRMTKLNDDFLDRKLGDASIKDIINRNGNETPLNGKHLKISSINEEWEDIKFIDFNNAYDVNADIIKIIHSLATKTYPISVVDINIEDTSNNMDYLMTYTVVMEDGYGKRSTLVFDIPKLINNRFMRLRGNEKVVSGQLLLLPCLKTDEDTVQCVSNYNKIFIRRKGLEGRSYPISDRLVKTLRKYKGNKIKIVFGDNGAICSKHELPVDYIDLAKNVMRIETPEYIYYFDQDIYYTKFNAQKKNGIPYAVNRKDSSIKYYKDNPAMLSYIIAREISEYDQDFELLFENQKAAARLNYSEASVMANRIPLVVVIGYSLGMDGVMKLCGIYGEYKNDNKKNFNPDIEAVIRFSDGYIKYPMNYSTSMLLNGLSVCPTETYSLDDLNKRSMWLDFLDDFGGRILADGLDNFADLFIDPITAEVCRHCRIPSNYFDMLMYANNLLADNKYNRHTDISGNRYRTSEIIAGYFYKAITKAYAEYKAQVKHGRKVGISMKRTAIIDGIMSDPMSSDLSILNPLLEIEANNSVSFKGLSGMNSDRSYSLDKRTYDDSMINKLALSTGFAANVGINRQTTIDMDVEGIRGYIKQTNPDDMSVAKTFSMSEAVTPFGTSRDDPFRSAMTFIQTSKHSMRTAKSMPLLVTNGADEAMPYMSSDTFAYKAKEDGEVVELTSDFMVIHYKNPVHSPKVGEARGISNEVIDLREQVKKNSDGGFYITLKLDTDLKVGSKFKKDDIIAYDKTSYSASVGETDNLAYNLGVLAKVAILNTDEGFEDSTSVSSWLSSAMATDVVVQKDVSISKNANIYSIVKVGQAIQEGDPLIIFQNSFDEKDANLLLKNITDPEFVSDLGRIRLKSKYTGTIQDIKIYRTCEIEDMSESLAKLVSEYEKDIKKRKAMYKKYNAPGANTLDPDYKMETTGIMKNTMDGVMIVFYIKYNDMLSVGDKVVAQSANKGVVKNIFPDGMEPFSEHRPEESIHALFAARSFNARMVTSVWVSGAINKAMIELDRQVKEIMGINPKLLEDMYDE